MTIVERIESCIAEIDDKRIATGFGEASREWALAVTHLEDAMMRYTRGRAIQERKQSNYDFDKPLETSA